MIIKLFTKYCISNALDVTDDDAIFKSDNNDEECSDTEIENVYHDEPMTTKNFCELLASPKLNLESV